MSKLFSNFQKLKNYSYTFKKNSKYCCYVVWMETFSVLFNNCFLTFKVFKNILNFFFFKKNLTIRIWIKIINILLQKYLWTFKCCISTFTLRLFFFFLNALIVYLHTITYSYIFSLSLYFNLWLNISLLSLFFSPVLL